MVDQRLRDRLDRIKENQLTGAEYPMPSEIGGLREQPSLGWLLHWAVLGVVWGLVSMSIALVIVVWYDQASADAVALADNLDIVGALAGFAVLLSIGCRVLIGPVVLGRRGSVVVLAGFVFGCATAYLTLVDGGGNG